MWDGDSTYYINQDVIHMKHFGTLIVARGKTARKQRHVRKQQNLLCYYCCSDHRYCYCIIIRSTYHTCMHGRNKRHHSLRDTAMNSPPSPNLPTPAQIDDALRVSHHLCLLYVGQSGHSSEIIAGVVAVSAAEGEVPSRARRRSFLMMGVVVLLWCLGAPVCSLVPQNEMQAGGIDLQP